MNALNKSKNPEQILLSLMSFLDLDLIRVVLSKWAELHLKREGWEVAEEAFEKSLEVANEIGLQEFVATALYGLARVAKARGRMAEAIRQGEESLSLFQRINHTRRYEVITWLKGIEGY